MTDDAARIAALEAENFALRSEIARTSPGAAVPPKIHLPTKFSGLGPLRGTSRFPNEQRQ
jgi:hypothetical protein